MTGWSADLGDRVQQYFRTRDELLEAVFERANELAVLRIAERTTGANGSGPRAVLTVVLTELVPHDRATWTHMRVRQSFTAQALADDGVAGRLRAAYADLTSRLSELIRAEAVAGTIAGAEQPEHIAVRLVALAEGLAYHVLIGTHSSDVARRQVLDAIDALYG